MERTNVLRRFLNQIRRCVRRQPTATQTNGSPSNLDDSQKDHKDQTSLHQEPLEEEAYEHPSEVDNDGGKAAANKGSRNAGITEEELFEDTKHPIRRPKAERWVFELILPLGADTNYNLWSTRDVLLWLSDFCPSQQIINVVHQEAISGLQLYNCFLNPDTSVEWCAKRHIKEESAIRVRMVLGKVHNVFYGYDALEKSQP